MNSTEWVSVVVAASFFYYGMMCIFSQKMMAEFIRFGLSHQQRVVTGVLQLLGAIGLVLAVQYPLIGMAAAAGLTLLMLLGFSVRIKIKDGITQSFPSFFFMAINAYLFYQYYFVWIAGSL